MITDLNEILVEWSYRTSDGKPDVKNNAKLIILESVLNDFGWSREARAELLSTLMEADIVKNRDSGNIYTVQKHNPNTQDIVKKNASDADIAKVTKDKVDKEKGDKKPKAKSGVIKQKEQEAANPEVVADLYDYLKYITNEQKKALDLDKKESDKQIAKLKSIREAIKNLPENERDNAKISIAYAQTYEGRQNTGMGKTRLGELDTKTLKQNEKYLLEAYGDGSPEHIEKFVREVRSHKISDEFAKASYNSLPKKLQEALNRKGKVGDAGKGLHYLGKNEDGTSKRGNTGTTDRGLLMWRIYLEQGGRCAYSGLPLNLESMDLEHVVAFDNSDKGKPTVDDYKDRENDKNMVMTATNLNQKKKDMSMEDFYEKEVRTQYSKTPEDFKKESEVYEEANTINSVAEQFIPTLLSEGVLKNSTMTSNVLNQHFKEDDERFERVKNTLREVATSSKDKKKAGDLKSKFGKRMCMSMGLTRGLRDKSGRRSVSFSSDNIYRGFLLSMADVSVEERRKYKDGWTQAIKEASDDKVRVAGLGQKTFIKSLVTQGLISDEVMNDKKVGNLFRKAKES